MATKDRNSNKGFSMKWSMTFSRFSSAVARASGKPVTFALCVLIIVAWAISGPIFHYSDTWQLIINTGTTIVTFLQVILIQNTQSRDGAAIQAKLDELIRAGAAHNRFIGIEELTEEHLKLLRGLSDGKARADKLEAALEAADDAEEGANKKAQEAAKKVFL